MFKKIIEVANDLFNNSKGIQAVETPNEEKKQTLWIVLVVVTIAVLTIIFINKK